MVSLCYLGGGVITWKKAITVSIVTTLQRISPSSVSPLGRGVAPIRREGKGGIGAAG